MKFSGTWRAEPPGFPTRRQQPGILTAKLQAAEELTSRGVEVRTSGGQKVIRDGQRGAQGARRGRTCGS